MGIKAKLVILKLMPLHQVAYILTIYGRNSKLCKSLLKMRTGDFRSSRQPHDASITRYQHCKMLFFEKTSTPRKIVEIRLASKKNTMATIQSICELTDCHSNKR